MAQFNYRALGPDGALQKGTQEAVSAAELAAQLQKRGAMVMGITPVGRGHGLLSLELGGAPALRRGELTEATRELASLLTAGQDIDRALRLMAEEAPSKRVGAVLGRVRDGVRDGSLLPPLCSESRKAFRAFISAWSAPARRAAIWPERWNV